MRACATGARTCVSRASSSRRSPSRPTRSCSCRRSSISRIPARCSSTSARSWAGAGRCSSRPRTCSRWRRGEHRARTTPGTSTSTGPRSSKSCAAAASEAWRCSGCSTRASCVHTSSHCRLGWDAVHARLGLTEHFYGWFTPAIAASDFVLRSSSVADLDRRSGLPRGLPLMGSRPASAAPWRSSCIRTCHTSRGSAPGRSGRSGCGRRWRAATCRCSTCLTAARR